EAVYKSLIAINPRHTSAYNNLGVIYKKMGRADESIASYRNQVEIDPRNRYATSNLSRALASRGQWEEALPLAAVAAEVMPEDVKRWHFLGRTQIKTGHMD